MLVAANRVTLMAFFTKMGTFLHEWLLKILTYIGLGLGRLAMSSESHPHMAKPTTVPKMERGKASANTKFEKGIAELINLMIETSCPGKELVFMKELISLSTTRLEVKKESDDSAQNGEEELYISVMFDGESNYLTFEDNGVGMTKADLINLGTIPKQINTNALISAIKNGKDLSKKQLFDVGFFTVFAVADKITIKSTPSGGTEWYMWESLAIERRFTVQSIQNPELECKTQVTLLLKKDVSENIRSKGLDRFLREHINCQSSSYKIYVQSHTVINSSKEGSLGPQEEAAAAAAVVTRDPQEHVGNTAGTLQGILNSNTTPKDKSPAPVPKTPGSASARGTSNISSLAAVKHLVDKNFTIAVKVMKQTEPGKEKPKCDDKAWHMGSYEVADSTDNVLLKVFGPLDNMDFFRPKQTILLRNAWIRKDHIAFTKCSKVEQYKGEIKMVEAIENERRSDEEKNRTLEEIKNTPTCTAAARLHISQVKGGVYEKGKLWCKNLTVKDRKNSQKSYELVTCDEVAAVEFEVQGRYLFHGITYNSAEENFQTVGQTLPKLVKSGKENKQ